MLGLEAISGITEGTGWAVPLYTVIDKPVMGLGRAGRC